MTIIPAIDIIEGKCVRLTNGDFSQMKIYNEDPLEVAKIFEDSGLKRLHLVDLDGAKTGTVKNWRVLETIAHKTSLLIDFGGGIKTDKDVQTVFNSGASMVTVGSVAVKNPDKLIQWMDNYNPARFFIGADIRNKQIAVNGWQEITKIKIDAFIEAYLRKGIKQIFCTDINKDGKLEGPSITLYSEILKKFPKLNLVASGGISSLQDLLDLQAIGCSGAIIGKAIYENKVSLKELQMFNV